MIDTEIPWFRFVSEEQRINAQRLFAALCVASVVLVGLIFVFDEGLAYFVVGIGAILAFASAVAWAGALGIYGDRLKLAVEHRATHDSDDFSGFSAKWLPLPCTEEFFEAAVVARRRELAAFWAGAPR